MRNLFIVARLVSMWNEFMRLNGFMWTKDHIESSWNMASYHNRLFGRSHYFATDSNGRMMRDADGNHIEIKRDFYDQILDFITDYVSLYFHNIFIEAPCTHPHEEVWAEWEGDRDYGYIKQHYCSKCGGYLSIEDVDQYRPIGDRHPELIYEGHKPCGLVDQEISDAEDRRFKDSLSDYDAGYNYISEIEWEANHKAVSDSHKPAGDTHFGMTLDQYKAKFVELGFEEVLRDDFTHAHSGRERTDSYYVYAHRDGWLIDFDTYTSDNGFHEGVDQGFGKTSLNSGKLRYNWQPSDYKGRRGSLTSSGGYLSYPDNEEDTDTPVIWGGDHDVREGTSYTMTKLKGQGKILNPWFGNHINWLASQMSVRDQDRSVPPGQPARDEWDRWLGDIMARSQKNFAALPDWVKEMIGPMKR